MENQYLTNLWEETISELKDGGKTYDDVVAVCCFDFCIPKSNFEEIAKRTDYDSRFGAQHVATDLMIVGDDFWLERHEYDGSEWWEYKTIPTIPQEVKIVDNLAGGMWNTLGELIEDE